MWHFFHYKRSGEIRHENVIAKRSARVYLHCKVHGILNSFDKNGQCLPEIELWGLWHGIVNSFDKNGQCLPEIELMTLGRMELSTEIVNLSIRPSSPYIKSSRSIHQTYTHSETARNVWSGVHLSIFRYFLPRMNPTNSLYLI